VIEDTSTEGIKHRNPSAIVISEIPANPRSGHDLQQRTGCGCKDEAKREKNSITPELMGRVEVVAVHI